MLGTSRSEHGKIKRKRPCPQPSPKSVISASSPLLASPIFRTMTKKREVLQDEKGASGSKRRKSTVEASRDLVARLAGPRSTKSVPSLTWDVPAAVASPRCSTVLRQTSTVLTSTPEMQLCCSKTTFSSKIKKNFQKKIFKKNKQIFFKKTKKNKKKYFFKKKIKKYFFKKKNKKYFFQKKIFFKKKNKKKYFSKKK